MKRLLFAHRVTNVMAESDSNLSHVIRAIKRLHPQWHVLPKCDSKLFVYNLGVSNNSKTYITRPDNSSVNVYKSHEPLQCTNMEEFWLSWANETVRVGSGRQLGLDEFIRLNDSVPTSKNFLAVSTGFGASGYWIFQSGKILLHIDVNSRPALTLAKMLETLVHN